MLTQFRACLCIWLKLRSLNYVVDIKRAFVHSVIKSFTNPILVLPSNGVSRKFKIQFFRNHGQMVPNSDPFIVLLRFYRSYPNSVYTDISKLLQWTILARTMNVILIKH